MVPEINTLTWMEEDKCLAKIYKIETRKFRPLFSNELKEEPYKIWVKKVGDESGSIYGMLYENKDWGHLHNVAQRIIKQAKLISS